MSAVAKPAIKMMPIVVTSWVKWVLFILHHIRDTRLDKEIHFPKGNTAVEAESIAHWKMGALTRRSVRDLMHFHTVMRRCILQGGKRTRSWERHDLLELYQNHLISCAEYF